MLKTFTEVRHGAEGEQFSARCYMLLVNGLHAGLLHSDQRPQNLKENEQPPMDSQLKPYRSTHHSQQHLSSSPSYRKYNTIFYKRTKRTEHLLSYKEQRTGKVCTANVVPPTQGCVNTWNERVSSLKPNTLAVWTSRMLPGSRIWTQNRPTWASFSWLTGSSTAR